MLYDIEVVAYCRQPNVRETLSARQVRYYRKVPVAFPPPCKATEPLRCRPHDWCVFDCVHSDVSWSPQRLLIFCFFYFFLCISNKYHTCSPVSWRTIPLRCSHRSGYDIWILNSRARATARLELDALGWSFLVPFDDCIFVTCLVLVELPRSVSWYCSHYQIAPPGCYIVHSVHRPS